MLACKLSRLGDGLNEREGRERQLLGDAIVLIFLVPVVSTVAIVCYGDGVLK